jgi:hypothetical protein
VCVCRALPPRVVGVCVALRYDDLVVGHVYSGSVAKIDQRGLRVRLGRDLYGTCRTDHVSDKQLQRPLDKLAVGQAVQCLVLESEPDRQKLLLSLKAALVSSTLPRITSFDEASAGTTTHGVVASLRPKSLLIELVGGVKGIVRGSELKATFGALWESDPRACYREGQVVECTVLSSVPAEKRLLLTLLSKEEASAKPAAKLLEKKKRAADGAVDGAADAKRRKRAADDGDADEAVARGVEGSVRAKKLREPSEATAGTHALATAVAIGEHGQILCRLDGKGSILGRVHMTELADAGSRARPLKALPNEPLHVVILGERAATAGAGTVSARSKAAADLELSLRPSELAAPKGALPAPRVGVDELQIVRAAHRWPSPAHCCLRVAQHRPHAHLHSPHGTAHAHATAQRTAHTGAAGRGRLCAWHSSRRGNSTHGAPKENSSRRPLLRSPLRHVACTTWPPTPRHRAYSACAHTVVGVRLSADDGVPRWRGRAGRTMAGCAT